MLANIKNNDQKCFLWCHVRHINPIKIHPEKITQKDKELVNDHNYDGTEFPVQGKYLIFNSKIEKKNKICFDFFVTKTSRPFQSTFHIKNLKYPWICCL